MGRDQGPRVVLTADRMLMGRYRILFDGMAAAAQTTALPEPAMRLWASRPVPTRAGRATRAPMGLRRLEAALVRAGLPPEQVAVVPPERLAAALGPATRVLGLSSGDPLGRGMNDETARFLLGGRTYTEIWFERLARTIARLPGREHLAVVLGGPGAWQVGEQQAAALGIDVLFSGPAEVDAPRLLLESDGGRGPLRRAAGRRPRPEAIPPILGPASMGVVELSRGCGWGCGFCTQAAAPFEDLPEATILADAATNIAGGARDLSLASEDLFRYGAKGGRPPGEALLGLLDALGRLEGARLLQVDHVNVSSTLALEPGMLRALKQALCRRAGQRMPWVNIGVESASGALLAASGCGAKMGGLPAGAWGEAALEAVRRLVEAGFVPMVSLILGLPAEEPAHIAATLAWVERLSGLPVMSVPVFHAPLGPGAEPFGRSGLAPLHARLLARSLELGLALAPRIYHDNLRAAGASRLACALVGAGAALQARGVLRRLARRMR